MLEKIGELIREKKMIEEGERVVVGLSGGADSVCLLLVLYKLLEGSDRLLAMHINHGIRGAEAKRDEEFVKKLCDKYGIKLLIRKYDIPKIAKEKRISEEEAGRNCRYEAFQEILSEYHFQKIAVAHNREDMAETFLFNLARGSALTGLAGMKEVQGNIIRPLLHMRRAEIEAFLKEENEVYVTDSSNLEDDYTRNYIRNRILPSLKENVNERVVEHISKTIGVLREADEFIKKCVDKVYSIYVEKRENTLFIDNEILKEDMLLQKEILYRCLTETAGCKKDIGAIHVEKLLHLFGLYGSKKIDLPYEMEAVREYEGVCIRRKGETKEKEKPSFEMMSEEEEIGEIRRIEKEEDGIRIYLKDGNEKKLLQNGCNRWFDYDRITDNLLMRTRMKGDYLIISKDGKRKKLKSYFIDQKIPKEKRDVLPLVASGSEILWVIGGRMGEGARVSLKTKRLLKITIKNKEEEGK